MMGKQKQYSSVSDLLHDVSSDKEFLAEFDAQIASRKLIKHLIGLRAARGMSQKDVADVIGCSQSRISKLERANDSDVRLGDLKAYANAVGCDFVAHPVPLDMRPVEKVKCHAFAMKRHLDDMAKLAKADEKIAEGVAGFFYEWFVNSILMLGDSARRLPLRPGESPYFQIQINSSSEQEKAALECGVDGAEELRSSL